MLDVHKVATQERRAVLQQSLRPPVIEEFMFRGSYTMEECVICFEEVKLRRTNCNHTFCEECLVKYVQAWVVNGQRMAKCPLRCPVCSVGLAPFDVPARVRHLMVWREQVQPATAATRSPQPQTRPPTARRRAGRPTHHHSSGHLGQGA